VLHDQSLDERERLRQLFIAGRRASECARRLFYPANSLHNQATAPPRTPRAPSSHGSHSTHGSRRPFLSSRIAVLTFTTPSASNLSLPVILLVV
jgi:hypothetical protein